MSLAFWTPILTFFSLVHLEASTQDFSLLLKNASYSHLRVFVQISPPLPSYSRSSNVSSYLHFIPDSVSKIICSYIPSLVTQSKIAFYTTPFYTVDFYIALSLPKIILCIFHLVYCLSCLHSLEVWVERRLKIGLCRAEDLLSDSEQRDTETREFRVFAREKSQWWWKGTWELKMDREKGVGSPVKWVFALRGLKYYSKRGVRRH